MHRPHPYVLISLEFLLRQSQFYHRYHIFFSDSSSEYSFLEQLSEINGATFKLQIMMRNVGLPGLKRNPG